MPYTMIEEIQDRKQEKIAVFLTAQNMFGAIACAVPTYFIVAHLSPLVAGIAIAIAAILGVIVTADTDGLPIYERVLWYVRGQIRLRTRGRIISPDTFTGAIVERQYDRATMVGGPIQPVERDFVSRT